MVRRMTGDRERYLRAGMDDYISKPIRVEDLLRCLQAAETRQRHQLDAMGVQPS